MADIATLGIRVETRQVKSAAKDLDSLARSGAKAEKATNGLGKGVDSLGASFGGLRGAAAGFAGVISVTAIASAVQQYAAMTDQYTKLTAQIKIATNSQTEFNFAMAEVERISATAQADISAISTLYGRLSLSLGEVGVAQQDIATISETVALALKVNGASAAESSSAMLQLSQAFGSGVLRGEEFNAVMESAPGLMRQLAASMGVPIGQLRKLASEGQITSSTLLKAFTDSKYLSTLRQQAKEVQTISGAFQQLKNEAVLAIGEIDKKAGGSKFLSALLGGASMGIREASGRGGRSTGPKPLTAEEQIFAGLKSNPLSRQTLQIGATRQDVERQSQNFARLSDGLKITSLEMANLKRREEEVRKEFAAGNITLTQYNQIVEGLNAERKSLQGNSPANKLKEESRYAQDLASDMADLIQRFEDAARPSETLSQELERQLDAYTRIDPAVKTYLQSLLEKVKAEELAQLQADALADSQEHLNKTLENDEGLKAWKDLKEEAKSIYNETRTPLEQFEAKILKIKELLDNGLIDHDTAGRSAAQEYKRFVEQNEQAADRVTEFWKEAARNIQDAFSDLFFDVMQGEFDNLEQSFKRTIDRMVANLLAAQLTDKLFGADFGKSGSIGDDSIIGKAGDWLGDLFGGFFADGGMPPMGKVSVVGENGPELFVPKSAGTIVPNSQIKQGNTQVNVTVYAKDLGSFRHSETQIAAQMQRALNRGRRVM